MVLNIGKCYHMYTCLVLLVDNQSVVLLVDDRSSKLETVSCKLDQYVMETYEVSSCVCGHHVFKNIWRPMIGEQLVCKREVSNA